MIRRVRKAEGKKVDDLCYKAWRYLGDPTIRNLEKARKAVYKAMDIDAANPRIYEILGYVMYEEGRLDFAIHALKTAISIMPTRPLSHIGLACVYQRKGFRSEGIAELDKALNLAGSDHLRSHFFVLMHESYLRSGDLQQAIYCLERAAEISAESPKMRRELLYALERLRMYEGVPA
jgi:tetratricopeptide (TPR) repeat protein